jgi:replicative DNA helicase
MTSRNEEFLEKPLPSAEEAEQVILGGTVLDNRVFEFAYKTLIAEDFYNPWHRTIYRVMCRLYEGQQEIDPISMGESMKSRPDEAKALEGLGGVSGLTQKLLHGLPHFTTVEKEVLLVKKHAVARETLRICNNISGAILYGQDPVEEIISDMEAQILRASTKLHSESKVESKAFFTLADIAPALHQQFQNYHDNISSGVRTGMDEVDHLLDGGGLQPGGIYVVAAGEKTGKTSLALDWAYDIAAKQGYHVPIVTLEMAKETLAKRLFSAHTGIPYYMFRPGLYDAPGAPMYSRAIDGLQTFSSIPISIADKLYSLDQIERHCRRMVEQGVKSGVEVGAIVIDYMQILSILQKTQGRTDEVTKISRGLKVLASEIEKPLIVISNLNRMGLTEGQEPDTFNLRDSGTIAFDAEAVFFLHNPSYVPGKPYEPKEITDMNLILSRQRNGPTGRIPVKLIGPYMQFMTEKTFKMHFGDTSTDKTLPQSTGQKLHNDQAQANMWDTDDDDEYS